MLGDRAVIGWAMGSYAKQKISQNIFTYFHSALECHFMDFKKDETVKLYNFSGINQNHVVHSFGAASTANIYLHWFLKWFLYF